MPIDDVMRSGRPSMKILKGTHFRMAQQAFFKELARFLRTLSDINLLQQIAQRRQIIADIIE